MRINDRGGMGKPWVLIASGLAAILATRATAQEPPPPPSPGAGAAATAPALSPELMDRFLRMEEANRKLLQQLDQVSKENQKLSKRVEDLTKKVGGTSQADAGGSAAEKSSGPKDSGLANREGAGPAAGGAGAGGQAQRGGSSGARSSGAVSLSTEQDVGNRFLGKIPLKVYYDYNRNGVGLATEDDEFLLKFRGMLQVDAIDYTGPQQDPTSNGFYLPRVRYYFQGHFTKPIDYQLSFQRGESSNLNFLNVFLNFNYDPRFQFRIGRFKVPYLYEWYKLNSYRLITPERSLFGANFGLNRQIGAMEWGEFLNNRIEYAVGIFDGPRNSFQDYSNAKDVMAFLNFRPFGETDSFLRNLNFGGSVDYGYQDNPLSPAVLRTNVNASSDFLSNTDPINSATLPFLQFNSNVTERGFRNLWALHLAYYYKGLSLLGEWSDGYASYAQKGKSSNPIPVQGFYVAASYLVTGETLNDRTVVDPIHRFDLRPGRFGLGALEPYVRYSELNVGNQVFTQGLADPNLWTNRAQLVDVGANWYLNKAVKIYFDWEHAIFAQPVYYRPGALHSVSDLFWLRFQLYF